MTKMTVSDLGRFLESANPKSIVFSSENQQDIPPAVSVSFNLIFGAVLTAISPNAVLLRGECGYVCFNNVKYALIDQETSALGTVVDLVCSDYGCQHSETHYTLIMS